MDKQTNIIHGWLSVIQSTLLDILKVQFEHMSVRAERIACIASLVKMFEVSHGWNDKLTFLI